MSEILSQIEALTKPSESHLLWLGPKSYNAENTPGVLTLQQIVYRPHRVLYEQKYPNAKFNTLKRLCTESMCVNPDHFIHNDPDAAKDHNGFTHYDRTLLAHRLGIMTTPPTDLPDTCINTEKKYARFKIHGKQYGGNRLALMLKLPYLLDPLKDACHNCGNAKCVNPKHLYLGTRKQNAADKVLHNTAPVGEKNPSAKLTNDQVKKIYSAKGGNAHKVAKAYKISPVTVWQIWNGISWSNVTGAPKKSRKRKHYELPPQLDDDWRAKAAITLENSCKMIKDDQGVEHRIPQTNPNAAYKDVYCCGVRMKAHVLGAIIKYQLTQRPADLGYVVRHKCRNTACCHFDHIELGTPKDNSQDRIRDNMHRNHVKLPEETARLIKQSKGDGTIKERAAKFNVSFATIAHIDSEETWQHIVIDDYEVPEFER